MKMRILPDTLRALLRSVAPQRVDTADRNQAFHAIFESRSQQPDLGAQRVSQQKDSRGVTLFQVRERTGRRSRIFDHIAQDRPPRIAVVEMLNFVHACPETKLIEGEYSETSLRQQRERRPLILTL